MRHIKATAIIVTLCGLLALACGCGTTQAPTTPSPTPTPVPTPTPESGSFDVLGTWIIQGQSADAYHLTCYPDDTYVMAYGGVSHKGKYTVTAVSVTIEDPSMTFVFEKGPDREQDKLIETRGSEKIEWIRV